jgi:hypothetical protein
MHKENQAGAPKERYEKSDVNIRKVTQVGLGLIIVIGVGAVVAMWFLFKFFATETEPGPAPSPLYEAHQLPPIPRLQANPARDLKSLRAEEERRLRSYAWVDRANGAVRIPIERAKDLVAERGLPYWPPSAAGKERAKKVDPQPANRTPQSKNSTGGKK